MYEPLHKAPVEDCTCGIYGAYSIDSVLDFKELNYKNVYGYGAIVTVQAEGKTIEHENGFRAQRVRIVNIVRNRSVTSFLKRRGLIYVTTESGLSEIELYDTERLIKERYMLEEHYCHRCGKQMLVSIQETGKYSGATGKRTYAHFYFCPQYKRRKLLGIRIWGNGHDSFWNGWDYNGASGLYMYDEHTNKVGYTVDGL